MSEVPSAVRKQAEQAEKLILEQGRKGAGQGGGSENPPTPAPSVNDPPAPGQDVDWEKRFKGMQKSHETTVRELREQVDALVAQNQTLTTEIGELKTKLKGTKPDTPATQDVTFSKEELDEYGEDFLNMVKRVAAQMVGQSGDAAVRQELDELKGQVGDMAETQARTADDAFFDAVDLAVPDWEQINETQPFKDWLMEEMPLTGMKRQHFLSEARQRRDANTVINLFNAWKGEQGLQPYYPDTHTTVNSDVEVSAQPGQDDYVFTAAEIQKFYDDKRRGRWKGRETEARQLEERIFLAQRQGRVQ